MPKGVPGFKKLVELDKIIAEALRIKSRNSKKVLAEYDVLIEALGSELEILMNVEIEKIKEISLPEIAEGVKRVREEKVIVQPGFDGQYGVVRIFSDEEKAGKQGSLFKRGR